MSSRREYFRVPDHITNKIAKEKEQEKARNEYDKKFKIEKAKKSSVILRKNIGIDRHDPVRFESMVKAELEKCCPKSDLDEKLKTIDKKYALKKERKEKDIEKSKVDNKILSLKKRIEAREKSIKSAEESRRAIEIEDEKLEKRSLVYDEWIGPAANWQRNIDTLNDQENKLRDKLIEARKKIRSASYDLQKKQTISDTLVTQMNPINHVCPHSKYSNGYMNLHLRKISVAAMDNNIDGRLYDSSVTKYNSDIYVLSKHYAQNISDSDLSGGHTKPIDFHDNSILNLEDELKTVSDQRRETKEALKKKKREEAKFTKCFENLALKEKTVKKEVENMKLVFEKREKDFYEEFDRAVVKDDFPIELQAEERRMNQLEKVYKQALESLVETEDKNSEKSVSEKINGKLEAIIEAFRVVIYYINKGKTREQKNQWKNQLYNEVYAKLKNLSDDRDVSFEALECKYIKSVAAFEKHYYSIFRKVLDKTNSKLVDEIKSELEKEKEIVNKSIIKKPSAPVKKEEQSGLRDTQPEKKPKIELIDTAKKRPENASSNIDIMIID